MLHFKKEKVDTHNNLNKLSSDTTKSIAEFIQKTPTKHSNDRAYKSFEHNIHCPILLHLPLIQKPTK